jgi:itaconyl-CoA hydratase
VNSTLTITLLTGMSVHSVSGKVVANLGWNNVKATGPVFVGDTLYAESKVLSKRESDTRPTQGIVTVETQGFNQHGKQVMIFERTMLIYKRDHSPEECSDLTFRSLLSPWYQSYFHEPLLGHDIGCSIPLCRRS